MNAQLFLKLFLKALIGSFKVGSLLNELFLEVNVFEFLLGLLTLYVLGE